jgi:hypothetical protein
MDKRIDYSRFTGVGVKSDVIKQPSLHEHERSQAERELKPTYFQKQMELEGRSDWSGGNWGGRARW